MEVDASVGTHNVVPCSRHVWSHCATAPQLPKFCWRCYCHQSQCIGGPRHATALYHKVHQLHSKKPGGQLRLLHETELALVKAINHLSLWKVPLDSFDIRCLVKSWLDKRGSWQSSQEQLSFSGLAQKLYVETHTDLQCETRKSQSGCRNDQYILRWSIFIQRICFIFFVHACITCIAFWCLPYVVVWLL